MTCCLSQTCTVVVTRSQSPTLMPQYCSQVRSFEMQNTIRLERVNCDGWQVNLARSHTHTHTHTRARDVWGCRGLRRELPKPNSHVTPVQSTLLYGLYAGAEALERNHLNPACLWATRCGGCQVNLVYMAFGGCRGPRTELPEEEARLRLS
jgi:hypothetical protein